MIAKKAKGRDFRVILRQLLSGSPLPVEAVATRNLGTLLPELAGALMKATAAANPRVQKPVLLLTVFPHPESTLSADELVGVAEELLDDSALGLGGHQALVLAYRNRVAILVNRVHPETGLAWDQGFDHHLVNQNLEAQAYRLGIHWTQLTAPA